MEQYSSPNVTKVECPLCGHDFATKFGTRNLQSHRCQVCNRQWAEMIQIDIYRAGEPEYLGKQNNNHPNIKQFNHRLMMDCRTTLNHFSRKYTPDKCGTPGCGKNIEALELLVVQSLLSGWGPQRDIPFLCAQCFAIFLKTNYSKKD